MAIKYVFFFFLKDIKITLTDGINRSITLINNLQAYGTSVSKGLRIIVLNRFLYKENEWDFYFQNPTLECSSYRLCILTTTTKHHHITGYLLKLNVYLVHMNSPFSHCHRDKSTWRAIVDFMHSRSLQTVYRVHYNIIIILTMLILMLAAG